MRTIGEGKMIIKQKKILNKVIFDFCRSHLSFFYYFLLIFEVVLKLVLQQNHLVYLGQFVLLEVLTYSYFFLNKGNILFRT